MSAEIFQKIGAGIAAIQLQRSRAFVSAEIRLEARDLRPSSLLQRSRAFVSAEIAIFSDGDIASGLASTEPRFCERGNGPNQSSFSDTRHGFNGAALL